MKLGLIILIMLMLETVKGIKMLNLRNKKKALADHKL